MPSLLERLKAERKNRSERPGALQAATTTPQGKAEVTILWFNRHRVALRWLAASPFVWFFAFFFFSFIVLYPITGLQQQTVVDQFNRLPQLPHARQVDYGTGHKPDELTVHGRYTTATDYLERSQYFDAAFVRLGWQIVGERRSTEPGRDYCKDDYSASVSYTETHYELRLTWSGSTLCPKIPGGARFYLTLVQLLFPLAGVVSWSTYAFAIGRAAWTLREEEFKQAMRAIEDPPPSARQVKMRSLLVLLISLLGILLIGYVSTALGW